MDSENLFNIELINNNGKKWLTEGDCYIKGFAFHSDELLEGNSLLSVIKKSISSGTLDLVLRELNGNFAAVINFCDKAYLISDKIRSYPLIYTRQNDEKWFITDSAIGVDNNKLITKKFNSLNSLEFLALGYVSGNETLYEGIFTVDAGEYVVLEKNSIGRRTSYFKYIFDKETFDKETIIKKAHESLEKAFQRTIATIPPGSQIVIPLSGGYDSRLIACLCKKYNLKNVVCYTYGRLDSFEVSISRKVAGQLEFEWHYVEYTAESFAESIKSDKFKKFISYTNNCNSIPHVQEFLALNKLISNGILKKRAIIIPGFCGDLFGGSKVPKEVLQWGTSKLKKKNFAKTIYYHFYDLNVLKKSAQKKVCDKIEQGIRPFNISTEDKFLNHYEQWCISNRLAKYIVNSIRVYEFFEMDWRMPLWDDNYAEVWYRVPWRHKSAHLLNEFMFKYYFEQYDVNIKKIEVSNNRKNFVTLLKKYLPSYIYSRVKSLYSYVINKQQTDINCFASAAILLCDDLSFGKEGSQIKHYKENNIMAVMTRAIIDL